MGDGFVRPTSLSNHHDPEFQTEVREAAYISPSIEAERLEFWEIVKSRLTPVEWNVIELHVVRGAKQDEVAEATGILQPNVARHIRVAISKLSRIRETLVDHLPTTPVFRAGHGHVRPSDVAHARRMER